MVKTQLFRTISSGFFRKEIHYGRNGVQVKVGDQRTNLSTLKHNDLIALMADRPGSENLWREFIRRFGKLIAATIRRECDRLNDSEGFAKVSDLQHDVYLKLLNNDGKALKEFKGRYENAVVLYLKIISLNVVRSDFARRMQHKRRCENRTIPLDSKWHISNNRETDLQEIIKDTYWEEKSRETDLKEKIESCLKKICRQKRYAERDMLIFRYYFHEGFATKEIAAFPDINIALRTVNNIITMLKKELWTALKKDCHS